MQKSVSTPEGMNVNMVFDNLIGIQGANNEAQVNAARDAFNRVFFPKPTTVNDIFDSYIGINGIDNEA